MAMPATMPNMEQLGGEFIQNFHNASRILDATRQQWVISLQFEYSRTNLLSGPIKLLFPLHLHHAYLKMKENKETLLSKTLRQELAYLAEYSTNPEYTQLVRALGAPYSEFQATMIEDAIGVKKFLRAFSAECNFCRNLKCDKCIQLINLHVHLEKENLSILKTAFHQFLVNITFCCCFDSQ